METERVSTNGRICPEAEAAGGAVGGATPSDRATASVTDSPESSAGYRERCETAHTSNGSQESLGGPQSGKQTGDVRWRCPGMERLVLQDASVHLSRG